MPRKLGMPWSCRRHYECCGTSGCHACTNHPPFGFRLRHLTFASILDSLWRQAGSAPIYNLAAAPDGAVLSCPAGQKAVAGTCGPCDKGHWCQGGIAQKCEQGTWNNVTDAGNSTAGCFPCPLLGTDCVLGDTITVQRGWYVHRATQTTGYKCALAEACVGGDWLFGELNCDVGYEGVLCGKCEAGYYRKQRKCASCAEAINAQAASGGGGSASSNTTLLMASMAGGTFLFLFFYLLPTSFRFDSPKSRLGKRVSMVSNSTIFKLIGRRVRRALPIFSGLAKVLLSYTQCIGALNRFSLVRWPRLFIEFMENLDVLVPEFLSVVPAECIANTRFTFYFEFIVTLAMPLVLIGVIALVLVIVRATGILLKWPRAGKAKPQDEKDEGPVDPTLQFVQRPGDAGSLPPPETLGVRGFFLALRHQNVFHLMIMAMLVMYPAIARKTMFLFDCMNGGYTADGAELWLLRDDPATMCYDATWRFWSVFAFASIVVYCLGVPVAFFVLSYKYHRVAQAKLYGVHKPEDLVWLDRVSLLVSTYEPKFWFCEALWMLHRFFFTGAILILYPETRVQVWFGSVCCLFVYVAFMLTRPFKYDIVDIVQAGCLLQLLLTYLTAFIFLDDGDAAVRAELDDSPVLGIVLVAINCIAFIILFVTMTVETIKTRQAARSRRLRFVDNRVFVTPSDFQYALTAPGGKGGKGGKGGEVLSYHIFLSHSWKTGQDAMRIVKEKLVEMVPGMYVFLDVDDLKEGKGAESVDTSCVILVFCTDGYFTSSNCMRELLRAVAVNKPILTVLEPDESKGRLTRSDIYTQLKRADGLYDRWGLTAEVREWVGEGKCSTEFYELLASKHGAYQVLYDALFPADVLPVEWDRISAFQNISLCNIASTLLQPSQEVFLPIKGVHNRPKIPKPRMECQFHMYVSKNNPGAHDFFAALKAKNDSLYSSSKPTQQKPSGKKSKERIMVTDDPSQLRSCERMLVHLTAITWTSSEETVHAFAKEIASAMALGIDIFMVHEVRRSRCLQRSVCVLCAVHRSSCCLCLISLLRAASILISGSRRRLERRRGRQRDRDRRLERQARL